MQIGSRPASCAASAASALDEVSKTLVRSCQLLGSGSCPLLAGGALARAAAGEVGLDEAGHAVDPRVEQTR